MRKIRTQVDIDRKKRKDQILIGGVMIALLLFSILGYSFSSSSNSDESSGVNEMGIDFVRQNGVWVAEIDGSVFAFQNLPSEVLNINVNVSATLGQYSGQPLYFVNANEGVNEVLTNLGDYVLRYQESCLRQDSRVASRLSQVGDLGNLTLDNESEVVCEGDLPVKGCESNLIIFEVGNSTEVYQDGGCVFIVGDSLKGADAFLYRVLQII